MEDSILNATAGNPVPENHTAGYFEGYRGKKLRYAIFRAPQSIAKGTVVLLHGRNECIEKYYETIRDITAMGFWVATFDLRGQGRSERLHKKTHAGHVRRFTDYERDVSLFLEQIVLPDARLPFYLLAHSTGALVALSMAPDLANRIDRMALCSPFIALGGQALPKPAIRLIASTLSLIGLGNLQLGKDQRERVFEDNPLTSDHLRFFRNLTLMTQHPELFIGAPTARWLHETLKAIDHVTKQSHLTQIFIPTLLLAPVLDVITPYAAQEELSRNFRAAQLIPVTGARHELLLERDIFRNQALASIRAFFDPQS
jgi:lysophospholipase